LHFGSLVAAAGSYLEAKSRGGEWLLRIEDLDKPREMSGAADAILRVLEAFGFAWDGPVVYQSRRQALYRDALEELRRQGVIYYCGCTRREVADSSFNGPDGLVYPGTCRGGLPPERVPRAMRLRVSGDISFVDRVQGEIHQALEQDVGDFVLYRADYVYAYQLAVVVDDAEQGVTEVVRGSDLLLSTPRQIYLHRLLGLREPSYVHLPVALNEHGEKLSKQTLAAPVDANAAVPVLWQVLNFLGQQPPVELRQAGLNEVWDWALKHWNAKRIPVATGLVAA
jgi:glutamyl-Q tRNA(Asp) synthetase